MPALLRLSVRVAIKTPRLVIQRVFTDHRRAAAHRLPHWVLSLRHLKLHDFLRENFVVGVRQLDQDVVAAGDSDGYDYRIVASMGPVPVGIVESHMEVPNPRRYGCRGRTEHRHDLQVLGAELKDGDSPRQRLALWGIDDY